MAEFSRLSAPKIRFIVEQDGSPERLLKDILVSRFSSRSDVWKAFLVRAQYGDDPPAITAEVLSLLPVVLCLDAAPNSQLEIVALVREEFAKIFPKTLFLDVLFLRPDELQEVSKVAKPFYPRSR